MFLEGWVAILCYSVLFCPVLYYNYLTVLVIGPKRHSTRGRALRMLMRGSEG